MVCIGCVRCEKILREFAARSFALIAPDWPICIEFSAQTKWSQMHQNMKFCINCTSSAHFAPSLVQEQNVPKCTQTLRNATKHEFRVPWCVSRAFVAKSSDATSWHELLHQLHQYDPFYTEFSAVAKRSQMHPNFTKCNKTLFLRPMVWIGRVRSEKFRHDFVA